MLHVSTSAAHFDGSQNHSHDWKGFKYAKYAGKPKNVWDLRDISKEQQDKQGTQKTTKKPVDSR